MPKYISNSYCLFIQEQPLNKPEPGITENYFQAIEEYNNHIKTIEIYRCSSALTAELISKQKADKEVAKGVDFCVIKNNAVTVEEYQKTLDFQQSERRLHRQGQIKPVIHNVFGISEQESIGDLIKIKKDTIEKIGYTQEVLPPTIQIDPDLMRDEQAEVRAISYARILGEFAGFLQGVLNYDAIPGDVKENILKKITELDAITAEQIINYDRNYIVFLEERVEQFEQDQRDAAGELLIEVPEPGTDLAKVMIGNAILRNRVRKLEDSNGGLIDRLAEKLPDAWEEKFEYWMTNNRYINKATTDIIIDHIKRYILPVKKPE